MIVYFLNRIVYNRSMKAILLTVGFWLGLMGGIGLIQMTSDPLVSFSIMLPPIEQKVVQTTDPEDIFWLALNIYYEARSEELDSRKSVAYVTLNRVKHYNYPSTIKDVVTERDQFSWYWDGKPDRPLEREAWQSAQILAEDILEQYAAGDYYDDLTMYSTHYHRYDIQPEWSFAFEESTRQGSHIFYY